MLRWSWIAVALSPVLMGSSCERSCETTADCAWQFCLGQEICVNGTCEGPGPLDCDDGITCTTDRCSEDQLRCVSDPPDADGDGYGDQECVDERGAPLGNDCDDGDADRYPGNREECDDGHDEDCLLETIGSQDVDNDGYVSALCSNRTGEGVVVGTDCDDEEEEVHPGQLELCNARDEDCDGVADEGVTTAMYLDGDNDGWGAGSEQEVCPGAPGHSFAPGDCDDDNPQLHP
ncbi:MAG: putative metal-binding motif-containing protein, partial [Deltaproteobacteria bacterium]|nr:putative metal-binding motif-containing protein [Deltaproteobacteria bacterium]